MPFYLLSVLLLMLYACDTFVLRLKKDAEQMLFYEQLMLELQKLAQLSKSLTVLITRPLLFSKRYFKLHE